MPQDAPKKIEEVLERYARERRASALGVSLHPVNRRLLQDEVARQYGAAAPAAKPVAWFTAWRMVGAMCSIVVVLAVGLWFFSRDTAPKSIAGGELAKADAPASASKQMADNKPVAPRRELEQQEMLKDLGSTLKPSVPAPRPNAAPAPTRAAAPQAPAPTPTPATQPATAVAEQTAMKDNESPLPEVAVRQANASAASNNRVAADAQALAARGYGGGAQLQSSQANAANSLGAVQSQVALNSAAPSMQDNQASAIPNTLYSQARPEAPPAFGTPSSGYFENRAPADKSAQQQPAVNWDVRNDPGARVPQFRLTEQAARDVALNQQLQAQRIARFSESQRQQPAGMAGNALPQSASPGDVLRQFSIERNGTTVRLTDADSSVYEGILTSSDSALAVSKEKVETSSVAARPLAFRAVGTNRSLNQLVVITGKVSVNDPAPQQRFIQIQGVAANAGRGVTAQVVTPGSAVPSTAPLARTRAAGRNATESVTNIAVEGTLRVGSTPERAFRAVPLPE